MSTQKTKAPGKPVTSMSGRGLCMMRSPGVSMSSLYGRWTGWRVRVSVLCFCKYKRYDGTTLGWFRFRNNGWRGWGSFLNCLFQCVASLPVLRVEGAQNGPKRDWQERSKMVVSWADHLAAKTRYGGNAADILTGMQINHRWKLGRFPHCPTEVDAVTNKGTIFS